MVKRSGAKRRGPTIGAGIALAIAEFLGPPAHAEIFTCGSRSNRFDGYAAFPTSPSAAAIEGSAATLLVRFGAVCDTDQSQPPNLTNFSTSWVMVASNGGTGGYSQSGYFRWYGSAIYPFAEVADGSGFFRVIDYTNPATPGTNHSAKTAFNNSCAGVSSCLKDYWDGTLLAQTPFNPLSVFTYPFSPQFFGEVLYAESDVAGYSYAAAAFGGLQTQNYGTNAWGYGFGAGPIAAIDDVPARWDQSPLAYGGFTIWTK